MMSESEFVQRYIQDAKNLMWFLGAGASRSAQMPTANDIIWNLKVAYYCREENQEIKQHDEHADTIKNIIQGFMDARGFPELGSPEEYSHYFNLTFKSDYSAQQKYLQSQLADDKIRLSLGSRVLAGLIELKKAQLIFTTNFDSVVETAYSKVTGNPLPTFHLEGSYAALDALNAGKFPIYAKVHGDFKYRSVKNLENDLLSNDEEIQKCFITAASRFGMVVSGYSGRDLNVMAMFEKAVEQVNAFPLGLYWIVTDKREVPLAVSDFIKRATEKGLKAFVVESGTFDITMSKIWRQIPDKSIQLDKIIRTAVRQEVNIPLPDFGTKYPIIRLNALEIESVPSKCGLILTKVPLEYKDLKDRLRANRSNSVVSKTDKIIGWGSKEELEKAIGADLLESITEYEIKDARSAIIQSTGLQSLYERALVIAICNGKPLMLKHHKGFVLAVDTNQVNDAFFNPLRSALKDKYGKEWPIAGNVPKSSGVKWCEAVELRLQVQNDKLWLMLRPMIWIDPVAERQNQSDFVKTKRRYRYNPISNGLLDAWIEILTNVNEKGGIARLTCYGETEYPATFGINTRTAYSAT